MKKALLILVVIAVLGAIGANPRYLEELRLGGGFGDTKDGGADFEKDGTIRTDGTVLPAAVDLPDGTETLLFGTDDDIRVGYDEAGEDRLEWSDGVNLLMSLSDTGTAGDLEVTGGFRSALGLDTLTAGTWTLGSTTPSTVRFDAASGGSFDWRTNAISRMVLTETQLRPATDKALTLGSASTRWGTIWGDNGEFSGDLNLTNSTAPRITATVAGQDLVLTTASGDIILDDDVQIAGATNPVDDLQVGTSFKALIMGEGAFVLGNLGPYIGFNAFETSTAGVWDTVSSNWDGGVIHMIPGATDTLSQIRIGFVDQATAAETVSMTILKNNDLMLSANLQIAGDFDLSNATDPTITASAAGQDLVLRTTSGQVVIDSNLKIYEQIRLEETETVDDGSPDITGVNLLIFDPTSNLTVTNFDGGTQGGEVLRVVNIDAVNTVTLTQTANIRVRGGTTLVLGQFEGATFVRVSLDSVFRWCQVG